MAIIMNNSANITYRYGGLSDAANSNVATTQLAENYSLKAEKSTYNTNWRPSENLSFSIRIENDGSEPLFGVSMQDNLGGNTDRLLNYIAGSAKMLRNDTLTGIAPTNTAPLTLVIPDSLQPGEVVVFTYVAKVRSDIDNTITEITNEVEVVGHEISESGTAVPVSPNPSVTIPKANYAEVRIEKSVDKENVSVGDRLTYTFKLENFGNIEATNVTVTDELPAKFSVESITSLTNGIETVFEATDYSLDTNNKLILPTSTTKLISVPARTTLGNGITTVTIVGTIIA